MATKEEWIRCYADQERYPGARSDVIRFIADIIWHSGENGIESICNLFGNGYCYHFAVILKDNFGGQVVWHKNISHILWYDGIWCYDINGIFDDISPDEIIPAENMGEQLEVFRHRGKDDSVNTFIWDSDTKSII